MKKFFAYTAVFVGAALFVLVDILILRAIFAGRSSSESPTTQLAPIVIDVKALLEEELGVAELPAGADLSEVPIIRPKWLELPPMQLAKLSNGVLAVSVTRPDDAGAYHDARFDWSGMIARVEYNGHWFFNGPDAKLDDKTNYPVFGTAEEFGMEGALGFAEARVGQTFLKIGVGELKKPQSPPMPRWYFFAIPYEVVKPGSWKVSQGDSWIEYEQEMRGPRGFAYHYRKRIELEPGKPVIRIARTLRNTGDRQIRNTHYTHNFVTIDGVKSIGPGWKVEFNYPLKPHPKHWRRAEAVKLEGSTLSFVKPLNGALYLVMTTEPHPAEDNRFRVSNAEAGCAVTIQGDKPVVKISLYASGPAICPEPFVQLELEPGQEDSWSTTYTFEADPKIKPASQPAPIPWRDRIKGLSGSTRPATTRSTR